MKLLINLTLIILTLIFNISAQAATTTATGKVSMIRLYGLTFDSATDLSHYVGTKNGFLIPNEYAKIDRLMSFLITAKDSKTTVTVNGLDVGASC
jgi:hypothetical protein